MAAKFEIDPYEVLGVAAKASAEEIRKAYRKQCLKYHPDKQHASSDEEKEENRVTFDKIQFAHSILSDEKKRKRYDDTGSLEDVGHDDNFDWFEYFKNVKAEITEETIQKDKLVYQGSDEEETDIIESWIESCGDFLELFESIPHTEITDADEVRLFDKVTQLIKEGVIEESKEFKKYAKNRKQMFNKLKKEIGKEAKAAEKAKKELEVKFDSTDELRVLIQQKRKNDMDSLIFRLEQKYAPKSKKKKKSK